MIRVYSRRNASNVLPVMWTLEELGVAHVRIDTGGSFEGTRTPEYLAMNPNARIPTIEDEGFVLWESNAIIRYLVRNYDAKRLLRPDSEKAYALADQWMDWHKTTLYPAYIDWFWAIVRTEPGARDQRRIADLRKSTDAALVVLEAQLKKTGFVVGDKWSMADVPFGPLVYRYLEVAQPGSSYPNLQAWFNRLLGRPAFQKHVVFPFGRNPAEWYRLEREPTSN